jgi:hypothetical protein
VENGQFSSQFSHISNLMRLAIVMMMIGNLIIEKKEYIRG